MSNSIKTTENADLATHPTPLRDFLQSRAEAMEQVLPINMKGQADHLIKRAMLYVAQGSERLQSCTPSSIVVAVLAAAEAGLPIDGKLAHAVPYNNKYVVEGKDTYKMEAVFQADYKGLLAVAKRMGLIKQGWARIVNANDDFDYSEKDGVKSYSHRPKLTDAERGAPVGAYAVLILPDDTIHTEWMSKTDIRKIEAKSKAKDFGPWVTDTHEMWKKNGSTSRSQNAG